MTSDRLEKLHEESVLSEERLRAIHDRFTSHVETYSPNNKEELLRSWLKSYRQASFFMIETYGRDEILSRHRFASPNCPTLKHPDDYNLPLNEWDSTPD